MSNNSNNNNFDQVSLSRSGIMALASLWVKYCIWIKRGKMPQYFSSVRSFYTGVLSNFDITEVENEVTRMKFTGDA
jgi:hypothetical protein